MKDEYTRRRRCVKYFNLLVDDENPRIKTSERVANQGMANKYTNN